MRLENFEKASDQQIYDINRHIRRQPCGGGGGGDRSK